MEVKKGTSSYVLSYDGQNQLHLISCYSSLEMLPTNTDWLLCFLLTDFNYGTEEYDAEGNEEPKVPPGSSETMPYIDESPTMSPQLSARGQESSGGGDGTDNVSPTPTDGLGIVVSSGSWADAHKAFLLITESMSLFSTLSSLALQGRFQDTTTPISGQLNLWRHPALYHNLLEVYLT